MITIKEKLIVTDNINQIVCRYGKKVLLKDFILKFSFQKKISFCTEIKKRDINPLLISLNYYQGGVYGEMLEEVEEFIAKFIKDLDESDLQALYFLTFDKNYDHYTDDFENNDGHEIKHDEEKFNAKFGRELAYKIYEPKASQLEDDLKEFLKGKIAEFSNEIDLSLIDKYTVKDILETIDKLYD